MEAKKEKPMPIWLEEMLDSSYLFQREGEKSQRKRYTS